MAKVKLIPLWVADMDFAVSDEIISALSERLKHPVFGYNLRLDDFYEAIISGRKDALIEGAKELDYSCSRFGSCYFISCSFVN